ncbi:MAG: AEC family transporter [Cyanobacteria bacterium P01_A01_bin.135]
MAGLLKLYIPLVIWIGLGIGAGRFLPERIPRAIGSFLFWIGVPFSIAVFIRQAAIAGSVWVAAVVSWGAALLGGGLALGWLWWQSRQAVRADNDKGGDSVRCHGGWTGPAQGSLINAAALGNTGYLGYPISLLLVGSDYFAWAVLYDTLGSTLISYGLGVALAAHFGQSVPLPPLQRLRRIVRALLQNPALWSFGSGLMTRAIALPVLFETIAQAIAWAVIALSLLLLGMRLSQLSMRSFRGRVSPVLVSLSIKMIIVPLLVGWGLTITGFDSAPRLVMVLQAGMPPAFATLIIAEAYDLAVDLTVTALALGTAFVLVTLPLWLLLFPV